MREIVGFPPNYKELNDRFHVRGKPVIFTYGSIIYNPSRIKITPDLWAHEEVHGQQQVIPKDWWRRYLDNPTFRLDQELAAHRAEYRWWNDRLGRDHALHGIAMRLCGPLYGNMLSYDDAVKAITA